MNNEPVAWMYYDAWNKLKLGKTMPPDPNWFPVYTHPAKTLTDEKINQLWAKSQEDGIAMQHGFTTQQHYFAHLILRKDSEK